MNRSTWERLAISVLTASTLLRPVIELRYGVSTNDEILATPWRSASGVVDFILIGIAVRMLWQGKRRSGAIVLAMSVAAALIHGTVFLAIFGIRFADANGAELYLQRYLALTALQALLIVSVLSRERKGSTS